MKRLIIAALLVVIATSVAVADPKAKKGGKPAGTKAGLTEVAHDYFAGIKASDAKKIAEYFAPDYSYTDLDGKMMNRDERLKSIAALDNSKTVFSEISVRTYGATGVVTGMATAADGTRTRFTQAWAWQGGRCGSSPPNAQPSRRKRAHDATHKAAPAGRPRARRGLS